MSEPIKEVAGFQTQVVAAIELRECEWCGNKFPVNRSHQKYCKEECRRLALKDNDRKRRDIKYNARTMKIRSD